jgi:hypothetical protein
MSEIPFVNQLGDAIEVAIARPAPARRRFRLTRRRYLAVALAALAVAGGSAAVAELLHDPVEIGFGAVGCFEGTEPDGNVAVITDPTKSPVALCAAALPNDGLEARDLLACSWQGHGIVVVARGDRGSCRARGLAPVPTAYALGRRRAARLQALAVDFESGAGCLAPDEFARRLTGELRRHGWRHWRAIAAGGEGPCGRVSIATGSSIVGWIAGAVDASSRTITVKAHPPLELELELEQPGSPGVRLYDTSGERCFTVAGLERHVREVLAPLGQPIRFNRRALPDYVGITGPRGHRYAEGCAVFEGAFVDYPDGRSEIVVELAQRDAPVRP